MLLEVIAETVEDASEAEQGGAGRIELVRELARGGLTPRLALVEAVTKAVAIPVRVMVRETEAFDGAGNAELVGLRAAARQAVNAGAAGLVLGFLRDGAPDVDAVRAVLDSLTAPVTFHRAFEQAIDQRAALARLSREACIDRVLTSGGPGPWTARLTQLHTLRDAAAGAVTILPGGGLDDGALRDLARCGFSEAHIGRAARGHDGRVRAARVAELVAIAGYFG